MHQYQPDWIWFFLADRMFLPEKGLYLHGWVEEMNPHPAYHWGRANGWALLTKVEVLDAIPEGYPGRDKVHRHFYLLYGPGNQPGLD